MLSVPHLIILFIVVLVVFGPHKLPELARSLGKLMAEFRKASTDFRYAFEEEMRNIERQAREAEIKKAQAAAAASVPALPAATTSETSPDPEPVATATLDVEPVIQPNSDAVPRSSPVGAEGAGDSPEQDAAEKPLHDQHRSA